MFREFDFASPPDKCADTVVSFLKRRLVSPELHKLDIARILTGFYSVATTTGKGFDALYFNFAREAAISSGKISNSEFYELTTTLPINGYCEHVSFKDIAKKTKELKESGLDVGLKFGHYRRLTISQIFEFVYARHVCDHLVLIIESGERTSAFKHKRIELTDDQRINMFKRSCLVNTLGMTDGLDYSDSYYRGLVEMIKPSTLFISSSWPRKVQDEYLERARICGASPFVIPIPDATTTTRMEPVIFREPVGNV